MRVHLRWYRFADRADNIPAGYIGHAFVRLKKLNSHPKNKVLINF